MTEKPRRTGVVHLIRHRRIIVEPKPEVRSGQFAIVEMRIAAQVRANDVQYRKHQTLMGHDDLPEKFCVSGQRPESLATREGTTAEHPPCPQIGMDVARLFDRKVALIGRSMAL